MAETSTSSRVRMSSSNTENLDVLRRIQSRNEVLDTRRQDELHALFERVNKECKARADDRINSGINNKLEKTTKTVYYGPLSEIPTGKWWGIRMDCSRDCVHEPLYEHVHHGPVGAISICTSHINIHNDVDLGDVLTFTGQKYNADDKSKDSLILSYKNRIPVRLVRSYCLSNNYAPKTGYRYDGLYTVVDHWIGVSTDNLKYHKFVLVRVLNQENPPWNKSNNSKLLKVKKSLSPRLTRSLKKTNHKDCKTSKFVYSEVEEEPNVSTVSSIVSRQVFKKIITGSPDSSPRSVSSTDSPSLSTNNCTKNLCNTNLSIRTNLYNSSQDLQDVKKPTNFTFCRTFKPNQSVQFLRKNLHDVSKSSTDTSDGEGVDRKLSIADSSTDEHLDKKIKRVTWADCCESNSIEKSSSITGNGFQYSGSDIVDGFSPTPMKGCSKFDKKDRSSPASPCVKTFQHVAQIHPIPSRPGNLSTMYEQQDDKDSDEEASMSIDSLAPDKLVNIIIKDKYHPMAKLLIGNMIGLENEESAILGAYNTLLSNTNQDDSKVPTKESKLRGKFYLRSRTRKNGALKKQRREIANLTIDAKFETVTRSSRSRRTKRRAISKSELSQRKLVNAPRIQSRTTLNKDIRPSKEIRELPPKKPEKRKKSEVPAPRRPRTVSTGTQCTLLEPPSVDQAVQYSNPDVEDAETESEAKMDQVDLDDVKSEPCDDISICGETHCESDVQLSRTHYVSGSAFAAVNTVDSSIRIARLRSIGFRPIGSSPVEDEDSYQDSYRPEVDEEYNKYTSEETNEVGYMDEQLHFEDIEEEEKKEEEEEEREDEIVNVDECTNSQEFLCEQTMKDLLTRPIEALSERDFDKPWHGWKKICANGQIYWTGY